MRRGVFEISLRDSLGLTGLALRRAAQIDAHIASLEQTIVFLKMERTNLRRKSGSRHPLFTPELLASIIEWGIFMRAFEPDDVMAVSTFWKQVVIQTPALWSRIIMTDLPSQEHIAPRMKRFLERSKDHTLHIELSVSESSWGAWRYEETLDALAKLLRPHIRRCIHFSLGRGFDSATMLQLVTELSPDIEYVSLPEGFPLSGQNDAFMGGLRVRDQKAANLTCIRGPLPYSIFVGIHFPVLKHLELMAEALVEWEMLLNLLTNTPVLRTLIIAKQEPQLTAHSDLTPVALPQLTTLRLNEWSAENLNLFFTYVSTPDLQELALLKTQAHAFPLDLIKRVKKLELPANSSTGWTARILRNATEVEELTMTSTTATREIMELLANQLVGTASVQHGSRAWPVPKMMGMEMDCLSVSGYNRVPVQELRGVLRRRRLGGVREISKLTLHGVEENEIEHLKGELDGEVERLQVLPQPNVPPSGPVTSWLSRGGRSHSPIIINYPGRAVPVPYIPGPPISRSRSPRRSPRRPTSRRPRDYTPPRRASPESVVVLSAPLAPFVIPPPPVQPHARLPDRRSRSPTPRSPPWRAEYVPPSTEIPQIIFPYERRPRRFRSRRSSPTTRSQSASPRASPRIFSNLRTPPPDQPVITVQDDGQDGLRGVTTFGYIPRRRSYRSSPPFSSSPSYTPPRRPTQLVIPPPSSSPPVFLSTQGPRNEESRNSRYHLPYRYGDIPGIPPTIVRRPTLRPPTPPSPVFDIWAEPSSSGPRVSSPHVRRPHVINGPASWRNGPPYGHPTDRFIPEPTLVPTPPEPFVVQVPSHPSTRVTARAVRRSMTPPLDPRLAFGPSVPPTPPICSGCVRRMPATGVAAPPCVIVTSNT